MVRFHSPLTNEDAVRRLRAVLGALDDDLARLDELLATPVAPATLTAEQWRAAEASREEVERTLRDLKREADVAANNASDWRAKAELATHQGHTVRAEEAAQHAAQAEQEQRDYEREINATRAFLHEWAVRVSRA